MYDIRPFGAALTALIREHEIDRFCGADAGKLADKFIYRIVDLAYVNAAVEAEEEKKEAA
jgi:hypothetical protein